VISYRVATNLLRISRRLGPDRALIQRLARAVEVADLQNWALEKLQIELEKLARH
jgi:hypothetical protein